MKPILFNTAMVQAILDGRKTQTRRLVHPAHIAALKFPARLSHPEMTDLEYLNRFASPKYHVGDVLYVRETWKIATGDFAGGGFGLFDTYIYKADGKAKDDYPAEQLTSEICWHPSIHMPKEAARIFLRITGSRIERLRDITEEDAKAEGAPACFCDEEYEDERFCQSREKRMGERLAFAEIWDGTLTRETRPMLGWHANPFVWVYTFEKISREEAIKL